ncbi:hypothetical protein [Thiobacillus sp.]|uniref:hypothetical protein n=1 Tax=Thiobacillus sp. TaxID=924 RepID=UPI00286E86DD|nr:hypothetical protein [Thiobacillus sp.]
MDADQQTQIVEKPFDTDQVNTPFGKRYGDEKVVITAEQLHALQQGKLIAVDVMNEYVLFIELDKSAMQNP